MKKIITIICFLFILISLSGCYVMQDGGTITQEQLIGLWQEENFEDGNLSHMLSGWMEVYFTDDRAIVRHQLLHTGGQSLNIIHFSYEIVDGRLELSFFSQPRRYGTWGDSPSAQIKFRDENLILTISDWHSHVDGQHTLTRILD